MQFESPNFAQNEATYSSLLDRKKHNKREKKNQENKRRY